MKTDEKMKENGQKIRGKKKKNRASHLELLSNHIIYFFEILTIYWTFPKKFPEITKRTPEVL